MKGKKNNNVKFLILSFSMFVLFAAVGLYATSSSSYLDISELLHKRPGVYMVRGIVDSWKVEGNNLVVVLKGKDGSKVLAYVPISYIERKYGPLNQVIINKGGEMVVKGYWNGKTFEVSDILKGCHSAYQQPTAST
ncbi:hypothetical protein IPA_00265 [Ignicoccus pacificus DSM 13166]|uniref:Uncharacterized protein n=1 Tax=Ignicoccus pacificus DSM 13166 TaxID=940294 RepID=A0A977PKG6_9CREN|nr:hypothetical protein IPA_00265 [Ignicoccus pacificus DSM 13166]